MEKENLTISIVLGIFVGIAATLCLQSFLNYEIFKWIGASIGVILLSIVLIYLMIDTTPSSYDKPQILKIFSIVIVTFFPFSLQKKIGDFENNLPTWGLAIHLFIIGIFLTCWAFSDKDMPKDKSLVAKILGIILMSVGAIWFLITVGS